MFHHYPVLLKEAIEGLMIQPNGIYIDATFGRGGHSQAILKQLGANGRLLAIDVDSDAIAFAHQASFCSDSRFEIEQVSFAQLEFVAAKRDWLGKVNGVLLDLGVSSPQLDDSKRGFSFLREGPLDMRMNKETGIDAMSWLNQASASEIADVLFQYGEERFSRRIAKAIVERRESFPIQTTTQLASIIEKASPKKEKHKHPATRSFQAIRIFINQELQALTQCLSQMMKVLSVGGRMCVISFHSLEDRLVKQFIQKESAGDDYPPNLPIQYHVLNRRLRKIGKSIQPLENEIRQNPRARSARLRIAEKIT